MTGGLRLTRTEIFNAANGDRSGVPNVIVLITDSNPTREVEILESEVRLIKSLGIRIIVVGVTHAVSENAITISSLFTARRYATAVYAVVVYSSVRLSITSRYCINTAKRRITQTTPYASQVTPVFSYQRSRRKSNGVTFNSGPNTRGLSRYISEVQDRDIVTMDDNNRTRMRSVEWHYFQWLLTTPNHPILHILQRLLRLLYLLIGWR